MDEKFSPFNSGEIGPTIQTSREEMVPYQEQKELLGKRQLDTIIVFGNGPVKPLLLPEQMTEEQRVVWEQFKQNPLKSTEPDFRILEGEFGSTQESPEQRQDRWQHTGRFGLNRWGRQGALAAGLTLYLGATKKLILSGGKTMPGWAKDVLTQEQINNWPSEAELMKDIIVRRFGDLYQKQYGVPIEERIIVEDKSTETTENFAYSVNKYPELAGQEKVGLLGADYHVRRIAVLAHIFSIWEAPRGQYSAQELLRERAEIRDDGYYKEMQKYLRDALDNPDLRRRLEGEHRWEGALADEAYLGYWIGSLSKIQNPEMIQRVLTALSDPAWKAHAAKVFTQVGLDFEHFLEEDLLKLQDEKPEKYNELIDGLKVLNEWDQRKLNFPPPRR